MYDSTIHSGNLARQLRDADFVANPLLLNPIYRDMLLEAAAAIGQTGFTSVSLTRSDLRGKTIYNLGNFGHLLVLRQITENVRRLTRVKQDDRRFIVECIMSLLREGVSFRMYKFDIKSFYESVRPASLLESLSNDSALSGQSARVVASFFSELDKSGIVGLPRGLSISATLAEYLMRFFDEFTVNSSGVLYYSRFVDDMCIITNGSENVSEFTTLLNSQLPKGLDFNDKSKNYDFGAFAKDKIAIPEKHIDYLGYRIHVSKSFRPTGDDPIKREVWADITPKKISRMKTRIASAMLAYKIDGSFNDLRDRIRLLTGNFTLVDRNTKEDRLAGIRFNYALINHERSVALPELDRFLRNVIMSPHPKNRLRPALTKTEAIELTKYGFLNGFKNKTFFHFSAKRLAHLTRCWKYV